MQCPNCHFENQPADDYCQQCGKLLLNPSSRLPDPSLRLTLIESSLKQVQQSIEAINQRLILLESDSVYGVQPVKEVLIEASNGDNLTAPEIIPHSELIDEQVVSSPQEPNSSSELWVTTAEVVTGDIALDPSLDPLNNSPVTHPSSQPPVPPKTEKPREWEQILGGNWLARIGVIALIFGTCFFLKFAFDKDWLGPLARILLGAGAGAALVWAGYHWRNRYSAFAQALSGGGIGLLYLCGFAAFSLFNLIPYFPAIAVLLIISGGSVFLAVSNNSLALAILGILGAFVAPFILGGSSGGNGIQLLIYIMVVDIGVLALSSLRNWRWFTLMALILSLTSFGIWHLHFGFRASLLAAELSLTAIFLIFVIATMLYQLLRRQLAQHTDYALMLINASAYFGISLALMWDDLRAWMGIFTLLVAGFYGGLAYLAHRRGPQTRLLGYFALGLSLVFFTIAIPVQLGDHAWVAVAWCAEGAVLIWLSLFRRLPVFRFPAYASFVLAAGRLLICDLRINSQLLEPVLNERVLAYSICILIIYLTSRYIWRLRYVQPEINLPQIMSPLFLSLANLLALILIAVEVFNYRWHPQNNGILTVALFISLAGILTLHSLSWKRPAGKVDLILMTVNALFFLGISTLLGQRYAEWMGLLYLILAGFYATLFLAIYRSQTGNKTMENLALGIAIAWLTLMVPVQFRQHIWTPLFWAAESTLLVYLSYKAGKLLMRWAGYSVFGLMAGYLLIFQTPVDVRSFLPVINQRFAAFLLGIGALYLAAWLVRRHKAKDGYWKVPVTGLIIAANILTLWLLNFEVWNTFDHQLVNLTSGKGVRNMINSLRSGRSLAITAVWAVYGVGALVTGILKKSRPVRLTGLGLLAVSIVKVFTYDVFTLETVYRITAFIGLGILLIISGYLYHRYRSFIKGFLTED